MSSSRSRSCSLISMPIIPSVRTSPSTVHDSMPGMYAASPPKSRMSFQTSSGLRRDRDLGLPLAMSVAPLLPNVGRRGGHHGIRYAPGAENTPRRQRSGVTSERAGIVLEHPAREVAAGPRREAGGADRGAGAERGSAAAPAASTRTAGRGRARARPGAGSARRLRRARRRRRSPRPRACRSRAPARCPRRSSGRRRRPRRPTNSTRPCVRRAGS